MQAREKGRVMDAERSDETWRETALAGSPEFLMYLHRGEVTWSDLWAFYDEHGTDAAGPLALTALFHAALSRTYDEEGAVLNQDGSTYSQLRKWAHFAVGRDTLLPEDRVRDGLAGLLALDLVSALYYEVVFSVYLEACLERQWELGLRAGTGPQQDWTTGIPLPKGRLPIRWAEWRGCAAGQGDGRWVEALSVLVQQHYAGWDAAYNLALGDEAGDRFDEGGQG
jgi:hypothetical protein